MRKIIFTSSFIFFFISSFFFASKPVFALDCTGDYNPKAPDLNENSSLTITVNNTTKDMKYGSTILRGGTRLYPKIGEDNIQQANEDNQTLTWTVKLSNYGIGPGTYTLKAQDLKIGHSPCIQTQIEVKSTNQSCPNYTGYDGGISESDPVTLKFETPPQIGTQIRVDGDNNKIFRLLNPNNTISVGSYSVGSHYFEAWPLGETTLCYKKYFTVTKGTCTVSVTPSDFQPGTSGTLQANGPGIEQGRKYILDFQGCEGRCATSNQPQSLSYQFQINDLKCSAGYHLLVVKRIIGGFDCPSPSSGEALCATSFWTEGTSSPGQPFEPTYCTAGDSDSGIRGPGNICIPTNISDFIGKFLLRWAVGLAGVAALFLIIFAGLQIMTAAGNPEKLQAGRELLTSAIIGLLFVIFSVVLLQVIGISILEIPGFGNFTK